MFQFAAPIWFVLAPVVVATLWWSLRPRTRAAALYSSVADLKALPVTFAQRLKRLLPFVYGAGLLLLVAALARPQVGKSETRINSEGIAIQLAIDISGSMDAIDFQLDNRDDSRMNAVKHVVAKFIEGSKELDLGGRPSDLVGLVAFGGFADSKCPLTLDHGALLDIVRGLDTPKRIRDRRGRVLNEEQYREDAATAIGDGLALALDRLRNSSAKSKVLILLTDGVNNAGVIEPLEAIKVAKELGVRVYTIGVGKNGIAPVPDIDEFGQRRLIPQRFEIDEELLKKLAEEGGGKYFHALNTAALASVYAEIDRLEKSKVEETRYTEYTELYMFAAWPGAVLLLLTGLLKATRFRALP